MFEALTLLPTSNSPMSIYSLIAFMLYTTVLALITRCCVRRMEEQDRNIVRSEKMLHKMEINIAVMREMIENIEAAHTDTRTAIAEINRMLMGKKT